MSIYYDSAAYTYDDTKAEYDGVAILTRLKNALNYARTLIAGEDVTRLQSSSEVDRVSDDNLDIDRLKQSSDITRVGDSDIED